MKKLIALLLFTSISFAQLRDSIVIKRDIFTIVYSEKLEQPLRVTYKVQCPDGDSSRKGMNFYTEKGIKTSNAIDYLDNEYDKGHLAPAADFNCDRDMEIKTFTYLNCSLQNQYLNRGTWEHLENYERELAKKYSDVSVDVILQFTAYSKKLITGATIPDSFTKVIKYNGVTEKYFFKNEAPEYSDFRKYKVTFKTNEMLLHN